VNLDSQDSEVPDVLSAVGQVNPPASHVLENARDVLWSAIAEEMLSNADARLSRAEYEADQPQRAVRQRRANNPQQAQQRRNAGPGA
jgi:hypothetical protein